MKNPIPPHIFWPGLIIALLLFSVGSQVALVFASRSDQGVQIEEDYYNRALDWDSLQTLRQQSQALGWKVDVNVGDLTEAGERPIVFTIRDRDDKPVQGLRGEVDLKRPSKAGVLSTAPLQAVDGQPGTYRAQAPVTQQGLWDLILRVNRDDTRFLAELRREV
ncbi:MAG: hypothetical protein CMH57_09375 [Myxococcales bacterium]|nr:hypothetical protein [Myxococcales bacterium]